MASVHCISTNIPRYLFFERADEFYEFERKKKHLILGFFRYLHNTKMLGPPF